MALDFPVVPSWYGLRDPEPGRRLNEPRRRKVPGQSDNSLSRVPVLFLVRLAYLPAAQVALVAIAIFLAAFTFGRISVVGTEIIPCDASLVVYCWTQDVLGNGLALVVWHMAFSLAAAWCLVILPRYSR